MEAAWFQICTSGGEDVLVLFDASDQDVGRVNVVSHVNVIINALCNGLASQVSLANAMYSAKEAPQGRPQSTPRVSSKTQA